ncbi:hypothetical protein MLD38_021678 [Melastoma candidum]|uniref:Uncharacterized protein n=1 Tax=Melastoma candidum TaxID=119954 RepID=A0ACB9QGP3_9MYRT|nr:hypothetical protein MLD38_021678 [Melastoma candidum]
MGVARNAYCLGSEATTVSDRKRKRMESNRESARRSRMRKQKQLEDLLGQASQLQGANKKLLNVIKSVQEKHFAVVADNAALRAQILELTKRLWSLNCARGRGGSQWDRAGHPQGAGDGDEAMAVALPR